MVFQDLVKVGWGGVLKMTPVGGQAARIGRRREKPFFFLSEKHVSIVKLLKIL